MNEKHISTHMERNGEKNFCIALLKSWRNKTRRTSDGEKRKGKKGREGEREKGESAREITFRVIFMRSGIPRSRGRGKRERRERILIYLQNVSLFRDFPSTVVHCSRLRRRDIATQVGK